MLFQSTVPSVFKVMNSQTYGAANAARKTDVIKRLDLYFGDHETYLDETLEVLFSDPSVMLKAHINIVRKIIDQLAMTYKQPPTREIKGAEKDQEIYAEMVEQCKLDVKLRQASRYTKLLNNCMLKVVWRGGKMDLDVLTGNVLDVLCGDTPEILEQVLITDYPTSGLLEDLEFSWWTADTWKRVDHQGATIESQSNPYKRLPFASIFDRPPASDYWLEGREDLFSLQLAINVKLTDLLHLIQMQSFGVGYITNSSGGGTLKVDPGTLLDLPEGAELGFASQQGKINDCVNALERLIKWATVSQGLSAASVSTDLTDRMSGTAKAMDQLELVELRIEDKTNFNTLEKELFDVMRTVWNYHNPRKKISAGATLAVNFSDPRPEADPYQLAQADDLRLAQGLVSPVDLLMRDDPDLISREMALARLMQIREESRSLEA